MEMTSDRNNDFSINDLSINDNKLIALINSGSGAKKGWILAKEFSKYDISVYNLKDLSVNELMRHKLGLELLQYENKCLVLICGGDGSNDWAANMIDKSINMFSNKISFPRICPFPMGTGNDLSRSLGWGCFEPNTKNIIKYIADIIFCIKEKRFCSLDRWRVIYNFDDIKESVASSRDTIYDNHQHEKYEIRPPKQFYVQQHSSSDTYKYMNQFNPPLPSTFLCYLSVGYDALVTHKFEKERKSNPNKFNNQIRNQMVYVKHGFHEFCKPSEPITNSVEVIINGKNIALSKKSRSLKLININSAANGIFFWGSAKSRDCEYKQERIPQLNDGYIEVMTTRGVHDMLKHKANISHAQRISQCNNVNIRIKRVPTALQIDGESWIIKNKCTLTIQIHDQLPVLIGYNEPRGVPSMLRSDNTQIIKEKKTFRNRLKTKYDSDSSSSSSNSLHLTPTSSTKHYPNFDFFDVHNLENDERITTDS